MKYISENLDRKAFNRKFDKVVRTYATELDITDEEAADILMDNDEVYEYVDDETMDAYDIVDKLLSENKNMNLTEAKKILNNAGYICEKKEYVTDVIIKALTQTNSGWIYNRKSSKPKDPKPRLEFVNDDGRYLILQAQSTNQQSWKAYIGTKDNENGWDDIKENISYYDILDYFVK